MQNTEFFFTILAMDVNHCDTYPASTVVNFQHSGAVLCHSTTYEHSGTVVAHDWAPKAWMSLLHVQTLPLRTPAPSTANWLERSQILKAEKVAHSACL